MASIHQGRRLSTFSPMRTGGTGSTEYATENADKEPIFRNRFFPVDPRTVVPHHLLDPAQLPERTWTDIMTTKVTTALSTTSNSSAPGPSGIGYRILKWAHAAQPTVLPTLYNITLQEGVHP